jgi:carboxymethylenebutenolidase
MVQEWWGLNDHVKDVAGRLAAEGYVVLAPDLYAGKVTASPDEAAKLMQSLDQERAMKVLNAAVQYLKGHRAVKGESIGVTGFCMGGSFALLLACNHDVKAAVPFYGDVPPDDELQKISAPVLFIGAENDFWITKDKMARLDAALKRYGKTGEVKVYPGVSHAFFNNTRPDVYNVEAAADAWDRLKTFFATNL